MIEFLSSYWLWIVLGIGGIWLLTRMGGMGCGAGGHAHGSPSEGVRFEVDGLPERVARNLCLGGVLQAMV